jgi:hypothetical protein
MAMADSQIYYPGSTVESRTGTNGAISVDGEPVDAYVTTRLATPATEAQVTAWYQKTLPAAGWTLEGFSVDPSGRDDHYQFHLSPPLSPALEIIFVDFRHQSPPTSGTVYTHTFGIGTP